MSQCYTQPRRTKISCTCLIYPKLLMNKNSRCQWDPLLNCCSWTSCPPTCCDGSANSFCKVGQRLDRCRTPLFNIAITLTSPDVFFHPLACPDLHLPSSLHLMGTIPILQMLLCNNTLAISIAPPMLAQEISIDDFAAATLLLLGLRRSTIQLSWLVSILWPKLKSWSVSALRGHHMRVIDGIEFRKIALKRFLAFKALARSHWQHFLS